MQSRSFESRVLGVLPLAWGLDALEALLASLQAVAGESGVFDVVLLGSEGETEALELLSHSGVGKVYQVTVADSKCEASQGAAGVFAEAFADAVAALTRPVVLTPPGPAGEELSACLASRLNGQTLGRAQSVALTETGVKAVRSAWGGRKKIALEVASGVVVACLRSGKMAFSTEPSKPNLHTVEVDPVAWQQPAMELEPTGESMAPVESCKLVVSGGRGVNEEGFDWLERIARKAKGTLGGSLPAVDAGMVPVVRQVGVSGKFVVPELYFAVGISGTPQHLAGIGPDTRIVAINKDPEAPIFSVAEAGVVGEWQALLPEVLKALEA